MLSERLYQQLGLRMGIHMEKVRKELNELKEIRTPTGRTRVSTNLDPSKLPETEPSTKSI